MRYIIDADDIARPVEQAKEKTALIDADELQMSAEIALGRVMLGRIT